MATLRQCIEAFERSQANRPSDRPIRLIRAAHLTTASWRQDVAFLVDQRYQRPDGPEPAACLRLALTGERLGLDRVGRVVGTTEVNP